MKIDVLRKTHTEKVRLSRFIFLFLRSQTKRSKKGEEEERMVF